MTWYKRLVSTLAYFLSALLIIAPPAGSFSIGEEKKLSEKILYSVRSAFHVIGDPDIDKYINDLGAEVLEVAGIQYFSYRFYVIENREFNAFAVPGGLIFFHTGLIETMNSEGELVSVLAHEIGHIVSRHLAERIEKGKIVSIASMAVALASLALGDAKATSALIAGSLAAGQSANLHFSRQHEEEADLLAYDWMLKLNRSPEDQVEMLKTMRRITRYRMDQVPQYLLTHPNPEARLDYVQSLVAVDQQRIDDIEVQKEQFEFFRFKYRLMSEVSDNSNVRPFLVSKITSSRSSDFDVIMAKYGLSQLDRQEKNFSTALKRIDEVLKYFPNENILLFDKGILQAESGDPTGGLKTLKKAYRRDSNSNYGTLNLANVHFRLGDILEAERLYKQVALALPEYPDVFFELGKLTSKEKRRAESSFYLGKYNMLSGKLRLAKHNFKQALKMKKLPDEMKKDIAGYMETIDRVMDEE